MASTPSAASSRKAAQPAARAKLERELRGAIGEIDEQGLLFLLRQAQVLIHNARVERMQERTASRRGSGQQDEESTGSGLTGPLPVSKGRPETVTLEPGKGGIFVTLGTVRKVLSPEEMKRLVRICYGADTKSDALHQLFTVLVRERRDILSDARIGSPDNPLIRRLFDVIRETYHLEDR